MGRLTALGVAAAACLALLPGAAAADIGASFGSAQSIDAANPLTGLACSASGELCAAADSGGQVMVSADGGTDWSAPAALAGLTAPASGLSCTADGMCVVVSNKKEYLLTDGATTAWSSGTTLGKGTRQILGLSCASEQLCVAVQTNGDALVSSDPASATASWKAMSTGAVQLDSVSCPSTTLCVAGDDAGDLWYSTDPASGAWSEVQGVDVAGITALSCQASGFCVAGDASGDVLDSPDVTQGPESWSAPVATGASAPLNSIACVSGAGGCIATSATATSDGLAVAGPGAVATGVWGTAFGAGSDLTHVACVGDQSCLAVDAMGDVASAAVGPGTAGLSTGTLSFGDTAVGAQTVIQTVTVTDTGPGALNVSGWTLSGAAGASFMVEGDTCSGSTLSPGASCTLGVTFAPVTTGDLDTGLQIASDDPASPATVALSGAGTALAPSPTVASTQPPVTTHAKAVAMPTEGRARVTRAAVTATLVDVIVLCKGSAGQHCTTHLRLTAHEKLRGRQLLSVGNARRTRSAPKVTVRSIMLGTVVATLAADRGRVVHLSLNTEGRRLLRRLGRLGATLTATQSVGGRTISTRRFHLSFSTRAHR
ncbi:MAG TPA: choice-of-anchor D domain-containing protein [Solirubrobacteraceae bacterium]|nr:choice-of-anchor D domain-containing protein [Solirubrobacteraceae bacterium]